MFYFLAVSQILDSLEQIQCVTDSAVVDPTPTTPPDPSQPPQPEVDENPDFLFLQTVFNDSKLQALLSVSDLYIL